MHNDSHNLKRSAEKGEGGWVRRSDYGRQQQKPLRALQITWPVLAPDPSGVWEKYFPVLLFFSASGKYPLFSTK